MKLQIPILLFLILSFRDISACVCADKPSVSNNWQQASLIFRGHVDNIEAFSANGTKFTIRILETFKQGAYKSSNVRTFISHEGTCDTYFEKGKDYLIYASIDDLYFRSSICSRTNLWSNTGKEEPGQLRNLYKSYKASEEARHSIIDTKAGTKKQQSIKTSDENIKREPHSFIYTYFGTGIIFMLILAFIRRALFRL